MKNPDITLQYLEFFGNNPNDVPKEPVLVFFGKLVRYSIALFCSPCSKHSLIVTKHLQINQSCRKNVKDLSLKTRKFIGNTSMDPELSLIMANHAKITEGDLVYDPFVGSGTYFV